MSIVLNEKIEMPKKSIFDLLSRIDDLLEILIKIEEKQLQLMGIKPPTEEVKPIIVETKSILKGYAFNSPINANTNIFNIDLETAQENCVFRIYACLDTAGLLKIKRTRNTDYVFENLNEGNNLVANGAYIFDILVIKGDKINLQYSVNAKINTLIVIEIPTAC
ncbi:MAG: hypothetical protein NC827_06000 [Candidatus Omnitrophica bacterium]|nr:hypothetical protein [Candidatus Omnitrophota bacterium]